MDQGKGYVSKTWYEWLYEVCAQTQDLVLRYKESVGSVLREHECWDMQRWCEIQETRLRRYIYNDAYLLKKIDHLIYSHTVALAYKIYTYLESFVGTNGLQNNEYIIPETSDEIIIAVVDVRRYKDFLQKHLYEHLRREHEGRYMQEYISTCSYPEYILQLMNNDFDDLFWEWLHAAPGYTWRGIRELIIQYCDETFLPAFDKEINTINERRKVDGRAFENIRKKVSEQWLRIVN